MSIAELVAVAVGIVTLGSAIGAGLWWLVLPRVVETIRNVVRAESAPLGRQLDPDNDDSLASNARKAADAAEGVQQLRGELAQVVADTRELAAWRRGTDRRLGNVEQAMVAMLTTELRDHLFDPENHPSPIIREDTPQ